MYFQHPGYVDDQTIGFPNDIALLELTYPVNISSNPFIDTVTIDDGESNETLSQCYITGWGRLCCKSIYILQSMKKNHS